MCVTTVGLTLEVPMYLRAHAAVHASAVFAAYATVLISCPVFSFCSALLKHYSCELLKGVMYKQDICCRERVWTSLLPKVTGKLFCGC